MNKTTYNLVAFALMTTPMIVLLLIAFTQLSRYFSSSTENPLPTSGIICAIVGLLFFFYWLNSIKLIKYNQTGVMIMFEKPMFQFDSGFLIAPGGITKLIQDHNLQRQIQIPADLEGEDAKPIIITHVPDTEFTNDVLLRRQTSEISIVITYKYEDFIKYTSTIASQDELLRQMRDLIVAVSQKVCSEMTVFHLFNHRDSVALVIQEKIAQETTEWGIKILNLKFEDISVSKEVIESINRVSVAHENNRAKLLNGLNEGELIRIIQDARADGYKVLAKKLKISQPEILLKMEMLTEALKNSNFSMSQFSGMNNPMSAFMMSLMESYNEHEMKT